MTSPAPVASAFARLYRLIGTFDKDLQQPWVRAVVDGYRVNVRALMQRQSMSEKPESPEVLVEVLEELHKSAVSNLEARTMKDGSVGVQYPVGSDGKSYTLES